jgi:penicillin-binding protein 1C
VLDRIASHGLFSNAEIERAKKEPVPDARKPMPLLAPHAADQAASASPNDRVLQLTIDGGLQRTLETLAHDRAVALGPSMSAAIVVVDNATGEVLARVASPDYFDERRAGQVDLTEAVRSPGSALKPFIYGLGFEDGLIHPETLIEDRPIRYGVYHPENFDLTFQGTVTVRRALQQSLNVPAVAVLQEVGPSRLIARLAQAGAPLVLPKREVAPGLALGLGGVGVRLTDLTMLYAGLARQGTVAPLVERLGAPRSPPKRLIEPVAAWYVASVLIETPPPENAAGGRIAFKTGTSYGYRDAWAVGFDGKRTVGVWAGRPDGAPVPGLAGRVTAAPILFDAFARLGQQFEPLLPAPKGVVIASTAKLPPPLQRFASREAAGEAMAPKVHIVFPPDGASLELSAAKGTAPDPIAIKIAGGTPPLNVLMNGMPLPAKRSARTLFFEPDGPGFVRLTVTDATGAADSVVVRLQ